MPVCLIDVNQYFEEAKPLFEKNWAETGFDFPLDLQLPVLDALQQTGKWFCLGAFNANNELIGYSSAVVCQHHFNQAITFCATDAMFLLPAYRNTLLGAGLIVKTEYEAGLRGAQYITWHTRASTDLAQAFEKRGYTYADHVMIGRL